MQKIKVLIVDDAVVIRKIVSQCLETDPAIEVVGMAANGKIARDKIIQLKPDLITLDIEMPEMDGLATLRKLRKTHPNLPVIMFSTLTERGGEKTLEALALGATDYVTKPSNVGSVSISMERIRDELIPKIKLFGGRYAGINPPGKQRTASLPVRNKRIPRPAFKAPAVQARRMDILAIGISTGGPNALAELFKTLSEQTPVPILIVQHMPPFFTKLLAERLSKVSTLPVEEATDGELLEPGQARIAPGGQHMVVERTGNRVKIGLNTNPEENSCRPAVDVLFRSVAAVYGPHTLAVVMTGMGKDGLNGCEVIKKSEGRVLVQDENSSVVWGMPGFVEQAGLADAVHQLNQLGMAINLLTCEGRLASVAR